MTNGRVLWFNEAKGFGFIVSEDGRNLFVHYSAIAGDGFKTLKPGQEVEFDIYECQRGIEARNVSSV